ncbi:hypothetical protein NQZ68_027553 [Dissostichus eleginoides]|nr:hypothetical protein NQZ68_027553 [Dissostichus eleginoides]
MAAILTRHLGPGCNDFLNDDLGMGRLTGTSSSGSPCQEEGSPTPVNSAGELPVAILLAGGTVLAKVTACKAEDLADAFPRHAMIYTCFVKPPRFRQIVLTEELCTRQMF